MNTVELVSAIYQARQQKSAIEKTEKTLLAELKKSLDAELEAAGGKLPVGDFTVQRIAGSNASIKADLLMERGVSPDVIQYATKITEYFQYKIAKDGSQNADGSNPA